ncbi:glycosyltransferase [Lacticigenium naphthae]|uniref:glycosyltransferase n=1 Tax=Lacticigenium naphthae TaxID=515351 RepID=UPI0003F89652|nr:glycosyltransferase [Lacticigenium naphthae]
MYNEFSVLLSVYQKEKKDFLIASLNSVINQSVKPSEIVIVKDGPLTEELEETLSNFIEEMPSLFKIVTLKDNVGLGLALNAGLKECKYDLVARMDTDDISMPDRFEKQLEIFNRIPEIGIVGSNISEFVDNPKNVVSQRTVPENHDDIVKFSRRRSPFNHPTVMYKKNLVLKFNGYSDFRRNQDYDLFVRMLNNGIKAYNIQEPLLLFRADSDNLKRRKSWKKTSYDIQMRYKFFRKGYSSILDLTITTIAFIIVYFAPLKLFKLINKKILRENIK